MLPLLNHSYSKSNLQHVIVAENNIYDCRSLELALWVRGATMRANVRMMDLIGK